MAFRILLSHYIRPQTWAGRGERAATPGSSFPSRSSREAPPPVDTWDTWSSVPYLQVQLQVQLNDHYHEQHQVQ